MVTAPMRDVLKCAVKKLGEQSVMTSGLRRMPMLPADKLAIHDLVSEMCLQVWTRRSDGKMHLVLRINE